MKRNSTIWWIAAIILAILAGVITYQTLSSAMPSAADGGGGLTQPVVVALSDIPFRRSISEDELTIRQFPSESVPEGVATSFEQVVGKMSSEYLRAGEPILVPDLVTPDIVTRQLALSVPKGKVVMPVPIKSMLLSNRLVRPGDRIDIIGSFELSYTNLAEENAQEQRLPESIAALQDLEVHAIILPNALIDSDSEDAVSEAAQNATFSAMGEDQQAVLLALDVQDALVLRHILDFGGSLDLVLRAPDDESLAETVPVDGGYFVDRYQINAQ